MNRSERARIVTSSGVLLALAGSCTLFSSLDETRGGEPGSDSGTDIGKAGDTGWVDVSCFGSCTLPHALTTSCLNNLCVIQDCEIGFDDCDKKPENGCEADLATGPQTCGSCTNACASPNGTPVCNQGTCGVECSAGTLDCNAKPSDGCEAVPLLDGSNCGECGIKCAFGTACGNGACIPSNCPSTNGTLLSRPVSDVEVGYWSAVPDKPHYAQVDDPGGDDGLSTYIWDDTQSAQSRALFDHAELVVPPDVAITSLVVMARAALAETATVPSNLWLTLRLQSSLYDSDLQQVPSQAFQTYVRSFPENPMTQSPWQASDLAITSFGVTHQKPIASTNPLRVTQIVLEVCVVP